MNDSPLPEDTASLKLQLDLERLDRQWLEEKQRYEASACGDMGGGWTKTGFGPTHPGLGIISGLAALVFGLALLAQPGKSDVASFAIVGGIVTVGVAGAMLWGQIQRKRVYDEARQRYENQRQEILQAIAVGKGKPAP